MFGHFWPQYFLSLSNFEISLLHAQCPFHWLDFWIFLLLYFPAFPNTFSPLHFLPLFSPISFFIVLFPSFSFFLPPFFTYCFLPSASLPPLCLLLLSVVYVCSALPGRPPNGPSQEEDRCSTGSPGPSFRWERQNTSKSITACSNEVFARAPRDQHTRISKEVWNHMQSWLRRL